MSIKNLYADTLGDTQGPLDAAFTSMFDWRYQDERRDLLGLYAKGKQKQWDAEARIDWSQDIDHDNPQGVPEEVFPLYGSQIWAKVTQAEKNTVLRHYQALTVSQFLHG